ncbi:MAG: DNA mismatch repair endonuclease MutL [Candidatus Rokubacteria bacterium]|nr:DNA mismatch repair endonuclease MutL [Candidatus Rokubacteria bacterium]MBI3827725.1 DNA mismatch repair endonuclease MutL [Candidatus Rokubacteria bacterium]
MSSISRIRRLPDLLINKIAAGEVVERPASAVKELVENALDAAARAIAVDLRDGGGTLIRVVDDGIGMSPAELVLALERHATSKLAVEADLDAIATLGFRGEALPAICAVSRFTITSRAREAAAGMRLTGAGGALDQRLTVPADAGTSIEVSDLFFNTPARLKFLKSPAAELAASLRALGHLALAHPGVQLRVTNNARPVLTAPAAADLRGRVGALWGYPLAERLLAVERAEHGVVVRGLASPPDLTRGSRDDIIVIVNGRPVRDPALLQAVLEAYRPLLPRDRFPMVALTVTLPFADVDANVHPTKAWVRFRHPRLVHEMLVTALGETLRRQGVVPRVATTPALPPDGAADAISSAPAPGLVGQAVLWAEAAAPYGRAEFGRVLGQVQETIIVTSSEREVFFLDQHAAHERVIFERLKADAEEGRAPSQTLLFPEAVELEPAGLALLERFREPLERLGFAFEGFGGRQVVLRAVPTVLKGDQPKRLVEAAVEELAGPKPGEPILDRVLSFVACHAAIKANTPLEAEEMERIVADLAATAAPYFCPHGRPTVSRISLGDIRRELRRTW